MKVPSLAGTPNPYALISEIAARVGIPPRQENDPPAVIMTGADGKAYDVMRVVLAVLDKIDAASKAT